MDQIRNYTIGNFFSSGITGNMLTSHAQNTTQIQVTTTDANTATYTPYTNDSEGDIIFGRLKGNQVQHDTMPFYLQQQVINDINNIMAKGVSMLSLFAILGISTGCWSYPKTQGAWSGQIGQRTLYVDDKQCQAAVFKISGGSTDISAVGDKLYLVDSNDRVIDALPFDPNSTIKVSGQAGMAVVNDATGKMATSVKGIYGACAPTIEVDKITDQNGDRLTPHLAEALPNNAPTTKPSP